MKFHIKKPLMGSIRHLDTYLVIFPSHIQISHVCSWPLNKPILDVLSFGKPPLIVCQTMRHSSACSGRSSHLLKGSQIVVRYLVLMVHICMGSIKGHC